MFAWNTFSVETIKLVTWISQKIKNILFNFFWLIKRKINVLNRLTIINKCQTKSRKFL